MSSASPRTAAGDPQAAARADARAVPGPGSRRSFTSGPPAPDGSVTAVLPRTGLQLPRQLPFESWLGIGTRLAAVVNGSSWCLGDWLVYGEDAYSGRYREALERTSLDYQTLRNYAWVARSIPISRRRGTLSFGHHAEVAALPEAEQDYWLRQAEHLSWSRNKLRGEVRASLRERSEGTSGPAPGPVQAGDGNLVIKFTPAELEECECAATRVGLSVDAWAAQALHAAAQDVLNRRSG